MRLDRLSVNPDVRVVFHLRAPYREPIQNFVCEAYFELKRSHYAKQESDTGGARLKRSCRRYRRN